jgi:hypothetical protein
MKKAKRIRAAPAPAQKGPVVVKPIILVKVRVRRVKVAKAPRKPVKIRIQLIPVKGESPKAMIRRMRNEGNI